MQFKKTLLAMMMFGAAAAAQADYQVQLDASFSTTTTEYEPDDGLYDYDVDQDTLTLGGEFYFSSVSTSGVPLDEAAFLAKASSVAIGYADVDVDIDPKHFEGDSYSSKGIVVQGHFVLPSPNLILEATYGQGDQDDEDFDVYAIGFGGYINDRITLMGEYSKQTFDDYGSDDSIERFTVTYRQLIQLGGDMSLALEPHLASVDYFGEDGAEFGIDAAFYLNRSLGFKAGVTAFAADDEDGDYSEAESYIGVDYFINENFRIGGKLLTSSSEFESDFANDDVESEGVGIEVAVAVRF